MSVITLISAHGSPGVTITALLLAATWPEHRRCLLVEADLFGGVIAARYGLGDAPGLSTLAAQTRRGFDDVSVDDHTQRLPGGLPVMVGPASPDEAHAVWRDLAGPFFGWAATQGDLDVIVDGGRLTSGTPSNGFGTYRGLTLVVTRPSVDQLRPAGIRQAALQAAGVEASLLLVGDHPYGPEEVAESMRLPVEGAIAWDPRTSAMLAGAEGVVRDLRRTLLVRSAATLSDRLAGRIAASQRTGEVGDVVALSEVKEAGQ